MLRFLALCYLLVVLNNDIIFTAALATPARSRKSKPKGGGGFAKVTKDKSSSGFAKVAAAVDQASTHQIDEEKDVISKVAVRNLFSACSHLQNPQLYQPKWADACKKHSTATDEGETDVIATKDIDRGQVITLFPIHALGLQNVRRNIDSKKKKKNENHREFIVFDHEVDDEELFDQDNQRARLCMKLNILLDEGQPASSVIDNDKLFSMFLPAKEVVPGWIGGLIKNSDDVESNCVTVPLPGAAPFCAVVATKAIKEGDKILQGVHPIESSLLEELKSTISKKHAREISSLSLHIEMACETAGQSSSSSVSETKDNSSAELGPFHPLNQEYPGLKQIHQNPDIYAIENFLTDDECDRIITKASPHLQPCLIKNDRNGKIEQDPVRTSTNTNLPQAEVPTVLQKMTDMACCSAGQLEILQVLRYKKGQEFIPHTDGYSGLYSASGFEQSTRLVTIFCYLNDVVQGGSTCFPELELDIQPHKGTAVIHFPADTNLREDKRTLHQGKPAIDDKWLLTTWVWKTERSDEMYAESKLPSLSSDII
ncbi:hypothetical protein ACHAXR_010768 [Thalassiosira sp. AJA248-18]